MLHHFRKTALWLVLATTVPLWNACGDAGSQTALTVDNLVGYWQMPALPNGIWINGTGEVMWMQASGRYEQSTGSSIHIVKGSWKIVGKTIEFLHDNDPNGARVMQVESFTGDEMVVSGSMVWQQKSMKIKRYDRCPGGITADMAHQVEYTDPLEVISKNFSYDGYLSGDIDSDGELHAVLTTAGDNGENSRYVTSRADGCGLLQYKVPALSYSSMAIDASDRMHLGYAGLPENAGFGTKTVTLSYATRNAKDLQAPWEVTRLVTNAELVPVVDMAITPQGDVVLVATGDGKTLQAWRKSANSDKWSKSPIRDKFEGAFSVALDSKGKAHVATAEWGEAGQPYKLTVYSETAADQSGWQAAVLDTAGTQRDYQGRVPEVDLAIGPGDEWAVISGAKGSTLQVKDGAVALGRGKQGALKWTTIGSGGKAKVVYDTLGRLHATWMPTIPVAQFLAPRVQIHAIYDGKQEVRYSVGGYGAAEANEGAPYRVPLLAAGPAGQVVLGTFINVFILPAPGKSPVVFANPNVKTTLQLNAGSGGVDPGVTVRIPELGVACNKTCTFEGPVGRMVEVTFEGSKYWQPKVDRDHAGRTWLNLTRGNNVKDQFIGPTMEIGFVWSPVDKAQNLTPQLDGWDIASARLPAAMPTLELPVARSIGGQPAARLLRWDAKGKPLPSLDFSDWKPLAFSPVAGGWWAIGQAYGGSTLAGQKFDSNSNVLARLDASGKATLAIPLPGVAGGLNTAHVAYDGGVAWWDGTQIQRWDHDGKPLSPLQIAGTPIAHPAGGLLVWQRGETQSTVSRVDKAGAITELATVQGAIFGVDVRDDGSFVVGAWAPMGAQIGGSPTVSVGPLAIDYDATGQFRWRSKNMPGTVNDPAFVVARGPQRATLAVSSAAGSLTIGEATPDNIQMTEPMGGIGQFASTGGKLVLQGLVRHGAGVSICGRLEGAVDLLTAKIEGGGVVRIDLVE